MVISRVASIGDDEFAHLWNADVAQLKIDVAELKTDVALLKMGLADTQERLGRLERLTQRGFDRVDAQFERPFALIARDETRDS